MTSEQQQKVNRAMARLRQVQASLDMPPLGDDEIDAPLPDLLDSMGLVEFFAVLAEEFDVSPADIEDAANAGSASVRELAASLQKQKAPSSATAQISDPFDEPDSKSVVVKAWLSAPILRLPDAVQDSKQIDELLGRPAGWFKRHAGISQRHIWDEEDPIAAVTETGSACLKDARLKAVDIEALLVTSEAPPLLVGLAAKIHHEMELPETAVALEVGGACTGFLQAVWLARRLLIQMENVLIVAVEAPSRFLTVKPGPDGEAAALFGDGAAACVISKSFIGPQSLPLLDVQLRSHGRATDLLHVQYSNNGLAVHMDGPKLASVAVATMADNVKQAISKHDLTMDRIDAIIAHGGNGRMPGLLARQLGQSRKRVWSQTESAGNLGSASLPAAGARCDGPIGGPVIWTAVGAGLTSAWALTGQPAGKGNETELPF